MKVFVPPGGVTFHDAFDRVHKGLTGDAYVSADTQLDQSTINLLGQRLRTEHSLAAREREAIEAERNALLQKPYARGQQARDVWGWWRGMLYSGAPPTLLLGNSPAPIKVPSLVWQRDDFCGDAFASRGKLSFYLPGFPGPFVGLLFFRNREIDQLLAWARARPFPLEAHATWPEIEAWSEQETQKTPIAAGLPSGSLVKAISPAARKRGRPSSKREAVKKVLMSQPDRYRNHDRKAIVRLVYERERVEVSVDTVDEARREIEAEQAAQ